MYNTNDKRGVIKNSKLDTANNMPLGRRIGRKHMTGTIDAIELGLCFTLEASRLSHTNSLYYYHLFFKLDWPWCHGAVSRDGL